ncbi:MAG TPA: hypothetical protein VLB27_05990, partial [candidate division Zixibacteria bacterium]|nr:hypothetical protein [candidate division Zixibacteria bacterium]
LLENTYDEWRLSAFATDPDSGRTCQQCHMPDRRHLWRGIHDSSMVRDGVVIVVSAEALTGDTLSATLKLTSVQVGHNFPTYATPKVYLEAYQIGDDSAILEGSLARDTIGWHLSQNLTYEYFDTRLAPGDSATLKYLRPRSPGAVELIFEVWVAPDEFYTHFYEAKLAGDFTEYGTALIERALRESRESVYTIFEERIELPSGQ